MAILLEASLKVASCQPKSEEARKSPSNYLTVLSNVQRKQPNALKAVQYCGSIFLLFPSIRELQWLEKTTTNMENATDVFCKRAHLCSEAGLALWLTVCVFMLITSIHRFQPYRRVVVLSFVLQYTTTTIILISLHRQHYLAVWYTYLC